MPASTTTAPPRLLISSREAADVLGVSPRKLFSITHPRGTVPCVRLGSRAVRYSPAALERWIEEQHPAAGIS